MLLYITVINIGIFNESIPWYYGANCFSSLFSYMTPPRVCTDNFWAQKIYHMFDIRMVSHWSVFERELSGLTCQQMIYHILYIWMVFLRCAYEGGLVVTKV